jgi:hypothetical protein
VRTLAQVEGDRGDYLRRDDVRGVQERGQRQLSRRFRGTAHAPETGKVVPDWDSLGGVQLRATGTTRNLSQGGTHGRLDHEGHRCLVT